MLRSLTDMTVQLPGTTCRRDCLFPILCSCPQKEEQWLLSVGASSPGLRSAPPVWRLSLQRCHTAPVTQLCHAAEACWESRASRTVALPTPPQDSQFSVFMVPCKIRIICSGSVKNVMDIFTGIQLNLRIALDVAILTIFFQSRSIRYLPISLNRL